MLESNKESKSDLDLLTGFYMNQVETLASTAMFVKYKDYTFPIVNAPSMFSSHIGNYLAKSHGLAAVYSVRQSMNITYSLRSIDPINVAVIAEEFGGGGHPRAAALRIKIGDNPKYPTLPPGWEPVDTHKD
jgi:nanoRNase/pAp phosphatase (c-di-AMP/oligoRNAs hydrolase)